MEDTGGFTFHPLTLERWDDLVQLFAHHGNPGYCWCTRWRLPSGDYGRADSAGRRAALKAMVDCGTPTGVLAYHEAMPVGWCSIAPRETYAALERSTTLRRIDDAPVWSVVCFFVDRTFRRRGLAAQLLDAAGAYAVREGAGIIESYPVEPDKSYRFMGSPQLFKRAGFEQVAVASNGRPIMRRNLNSS
jgi:GNAT superfamily N-acetyltransferase